MMTESPSDSGIAVIVELLLGIFTGIMGVGHIFAGSFGNGVLIMFCYGVIVVAQYMLLFVKLGFFGLIFALFLDPVFWMEKVVFSILSAYSISIKKSAMFGNFVFWMSVLLAVYAIISAKQAGATIAGM